MRLLSTEFVYLYLAYHRHLQYSCAYCSFESENLRSSECILLYDVVTVRLSLTLGQSEQC